MKTNDEKAPHAEGARNAMSNTMGTEFCVAALEEAIHRHGRPDIFKRTVSRSSL